VWRDERCVAFMSINPLAAGHVLVVPIEEIDQWIDAPPSLSEHLFAVAHQIGTAQRVAFDCDRVGLIVAGYEVPHMHIHVIPTSSMAQLNFANAASSVAPDALEQSASVIRRALRDGGANGVSD